MVPTIIYVLHGSNGLKRRCVALQADGSRSAKKSRSPKGQASDVRTRINRAETHSNHTFTAADNAHVCCAACAIRTIIACHTFHHCKIPCETTVAGLAALRSDSTLSLQVFDLHCQPRD